MVNLVRDIKLKLINSDVTINTSELPGAFYFIFKRRLIKDLLKIGILTGSRALKCYRIDGKKIINRKCNDWDFILSEKELIEFFRDNKIFNFELGRAEYYITHSLMTFYGDYGSSDIEIIPCKINIFVKNCDNFIKKDGIKFATLPEIIDSKVKSSKDMTKTSDFRVKHRNDINNIFLNIY